MNPGLRTSANPSPLRFTGCDMITNYKITGSRSKGVCKVQEEPEKGKNHTQRKREGQNSRKA